MLNSGERARFLVCLAAYNGMDYISDQINSILLQADVEVKIFISIDQSTDGTEVFLENWALYEPRLKILPIGQRLGGAAQNFYRLLRDIDLKDFDYLSFSDQDDIWLKSKLYRAHKMLIGLEADGYSSNVTAFWADGRKALIKKSHPQVQWDFLFEGGGPGCTYVMRKKLACAFQNVVKSHWNDVQEIGLHDWFVYAYARASGYRWVIDDIPGMYYRQHNNNQVGANAGWRAFFHRANIVLSGWGLTQAALIAKLVGLNNNPFVLRWIRGDAFGFVYLALHAGHCRRRLRDKFIFGVVCLLLSVMRKRSL